MAGCWSATEKDFLSGRGAISIPKGHSGTPRGGVLRLPEMVGDSGPIGRQRVEDILWHLAMSTGGHSCTRLWSKGLVSGGEPDWPLLL